MSEEMPTYQIFIDQRKGTFYAYTPDLPGCDAIGSTEDEVEQLIRQRIDRYIAALASVGIPPPEPAPIRAAMVKIENGIAYSIVADPEYSLYDLLTGSIKARADHSNAGSAEKKRRAIKALIKARIEANPKAQDKEVWNSIPDDCGPEEVESGGTTYEVYRDGNNVFQEQRNSGRQSKISYRTFQTYVTEARREIRKK